MSKIQVTKGKHLTCFGHFEFGIGNCLEFGVWDLEFDRHCDRVQSQWGMEKKGVEKKIGLFGGTFNPIHLGHLRGAEEIRETFGLQEVIFIPAALPPHKTTKEIIEAHHRLEMVKQATRKNSKFSASDVELKRQGKSYSIDTIRYFREKFEDSLYFILGKE